MFFFRPGGASNVTLSEPSSKVVGNLLCGSDERKRRKSLCFCRLYTSFSRVGSHDTARCMFLRNSQSPERALSRSRLRASSAWPCPIATSWYLSLPMVVAAYSLSSCEGSAPGVVMKRMGWLGLLSSSTSCLRLKAAGATERTLSVLHTNFVMAVCRWSGLKDLTSSRAWNWEILPDTLPGTMAASLASVPVAQEAHRPESCSSQAWTSWGKLEASRAYAPAVSSRTHEGFWP
mmetsp:Transcript_33539/g.74229  ORF Transcript_33539/g.74229 Transcript_33539/m.74229 type:complete len:233 (-) Transcript_33539:3908-4606(-)